MLKEVTENLVTYFSKYDKKIVSLVLKTIPQGMVNILEENIRIL